MNTRVNTRVNVRPPRTMKAKDRERVNKELERQRDALRALVQAASGGASKGTKK